MVETTGSRAGAALIGEFLAEPATGTKRVELSDGAVVYEPGASADYLYYIHAGQMRMYLNGPELSTRLTDILGPGDWFGVEALTDRKVCTSRAVAVSHTVVSMMPVDRVITLLGQHPMVAMQLIRQLANKLQAAQEDAAGLVFEDCNARVVKTLLNFSTSAAATQEADGAVKLKMTHRQLAEAVGAARETVSLAITELRHQKIIQTGRNRLVFKPETLRAFSKRSAGTNAVSK